MPACAHGGAMHGWIILEKPLGLGSTQAVGAVKRVCREAGLEEVAKWGHPCYMHAGRNVAIIGAFTGVIGVANDFTAALNSLRAVSGASGPCTLSPRALACATTGCSTSISSRPKMPPSPA